jgi:CHC2 zinc finger
MNNIDFDVLRQRIPLLTYCQQRGIALRRSARVWIGRCPIHRERNGASFVVWSDQRWSCFGKCSRGGDVIDLERSLGGGSVVEAVERLGGQLPQFVPPSEKPKAKKSSAWNWSKALRHGNESELARLAADRRIDVEACRLAEARGLLRFLDHREGVAWVFTDSIRENAVARLLGGGLWDNGAKAKNLPDSRAKRPIGIIEAIGFENVAVVEGGPDALAAFHFALKASTDDIVGVVCMTSANAEFSAGDLARLRGKAVRLFPHADEKGRAAGLRWLTQLRLVAVHLDVADFAGLIRSNGNRAKDLNDLTNLYAHGGDPLQQELASLMTFGADERGTP